MDEPDRTTRPATGAGDASAGTGRPAPGGRRTRPHARSDATPAEEAPGLSKGCVTSARSSLLDRPPSLADVLGAAFPTADEVAEATWGFDEDHDGRFVITSTPGAITMKRSRGRTARTVEPKDHTPRQVRGPRGSQVPTTRFHPRAMQRMAQRLATLDYRPLFADPTRQVVMVTLTWPGDPSTWASAAQAKAQFRRFYPRLRRALGPPLLGAWVWEFQRRGAPHVHALLALPARIGGEPRRQWLRRTWFECVGSGDERHLRAGTAIDWNESTRFVSPVSVAIYFARHSGTKAYQKRPPESWVCQGKEAYRWWGYWGLCPLATEVRINDLVAVEMKRILQAHYRSRHARRSLVRPVRRAVLTADPVTGELVPVRDEGGRVVSVPVLRRSIRRDRTGVPVLDARGQCSPILDGTGQPVLAPYYRRVHRRPHLRWLQNAAGGTYLMRNAPAFLELLAIAATEAAVAKLEDQPQGKVQQRTLRRTA